MTNSPYSDQPPTDGEESPFTTTPPPPQPRPQIQIQLPQTGPTVTYAIIAVTVLVFLAQLATQTFLGNDIPVMLGIKYNTLIDAGQYWRLLTPMLLHGSFLHIGFNMYAVYLLGRLLERFYGHWKFLLLYVLGGFTGALASYLLTPNPSLGASTSTFGLLAAYGILAYRNKLIFGSRAKLMLRNAIQVGVLNLIIGLSGGIDNWAHLGGALGGIALAWFAGPVFELTGSTMETMRIKNKITDRLFVSVFLGLFLMAGVIAIVLPGAV